MSERKPFEPVKDECGGHMGLGCINATNANAAIAQDASFHFAELGKLKAHHSVAVEAKN